MRRLIEREAPLERIAALLDDAEADRGRCVLVEGEAGIGKTALLAAAGAQARKRGIRVLAARCARLEHAHLFGTVRQLFAPVLRNTAPGARDALFADAAGLAAPLLLADGARRAPAPTGTSDYATLHGLYWLLANLAGGTPVLVAVDDAQWSDLPSLRFLDFLVRRLDGLPVALLVATRSDAAEPEHPALATLRGGREAERIEPAALSLAGVSTLIDEHVGEGGDPGLTVACREATRGNPFYLHALLRDLVGSGHGAADTSAERVRALAPRDVTRMVARRLEPLPATATALAESVAVLGDGAALRDAAALAELDVAEAADAAEALARAELFASDALAFMHPIVRSAVSDGLGARRRTERHGAAAVLLAERGRDAGDVAAHLMLAAPGVHGAAATLATAAGAALSRGAPEVAAAYLQRALDEPLDAVGRHEVLIALGGAETRAGMPTAVARLEEAISVAPGPTQRGRAVSHLSRVLMMQGRMPEAVRMLHQEIAAAAGDPERVTRHQTDLVVLADIDLAARPLVAARLRRAVAGGTSPLALGHRAIELVCAGTSAVAAGDLAEAALADGTLLTQSVAGGQLYFAMAFVLTVAGRFAAAAHHLDAGLEHARQHGAAISFVTGSAQRAALAARGGTVGDAEVDARAALEIARLNGWPPLAQMALTGLIDALLARDEPERAATELAASGLDTVPESETVQDTVLLEARGRLRVSLGEAQAGVADLLEAGRRLLSWDMRNPAPFAWRSAAALGLARLAQRDRALAFVGEEVELARAWGAPRPLGLALRVHGVIAGGDAGIALLREAVAVLTPSGPELERAHALTELGAALRRANRRAEARPLLRAALDAARECGSDALSHRAHTELWATGARPRTPLRTGLEALTPSERRVAEIAAAGRSNPEIAQSLFVTVKTIEMHLSSAYRRLGIAGRAELAVALESPTGAVNAVRAGRAMRVPGSCDPEVRS